MPDPKHIAIIGAGPGGLTAAMLLAHRGFKVSLFERESQVGGRNGEIRLGDYRFDIGPTFLMMKFLLDEVFEETGRKAADYMEFTSLDPMYELKFKDRSVFPSPDPDKMRAQLSEQFPGEEGGFERFMEQERIRFVRMYPCLQKDYSSLTSMLRPVLFRALPHLSLTKSLYQVLGGYFKPEELRLSFTFQSKYLGMSPWTCPGAFTIIPYIEYAFGIFHVTGGLSEISRAMAKVVKEEGGEIHLNTTIKRVLVENGATRGVELEDGRQILADDVIVNADFAHAMTTLFEPGTLHKYTPTDLASREYSCSTFMLYLGMDKQYDMQVHTICFADDYERNLREIAHEKVLSEDMSFYVRNASRIDPTLAPPGHSAMYVLVPVPNLSGKVDWQKEGPAFREKVIDAMARRTPMSDIREHIKEARFIDPEQWQNEHHVYNGATFNLAHTLGQMLYLRPRNRFEELDHCYLVGGGTHPGSGLPTIYESGQISANLICQSYGIPHPPQVPFEEHEHRLHSERG